MIGKTRAAKASERRRVASPPALRRVAGLFAALCIVKAKNLPVVVPGDIDVLVGDASMKICPSDGGPLHTRHPKAASMFAPRQEGRYLHRLIKLKLSLPTPGVTRHRCDRQVSDRLLRAAPIIRHAKGSFPRHVLASRSGSALCTRMIQLWLKPMAAHPSAACGHLWGTTS